MKTMTNRERIMETLRFNSVDKLAWSPLIDDYFVSSLPKQGYNYDILEIMRYIGFDYMERHVQPVEPYYTNEVYYSEKMFGTKKVSTFDTPLGKITEERETEKSQFIISKHYVNSEEELRIYRYVVDNTNYKANELIFLERERLIGDSGIATAEGFNSPIQELIENALGLERTAYYFDDYEDEMNELIGAIQRRNMKYYKELARTSAPVVIDYEDTSTTVLSRDWLKDYSIPYIHEYNTVMKDAGKLFITHMCGKLKGFINEVDTLPVYGIDSLCPPTTGDLFCWDARKKWGLKKVIIGGIEPAALVLNSKESCIDFVAEIIRNMDDKRGFILSTGDATPHMTPVKTLQAIKYFIDILGEKVFANNISESEIMAAREEALFRSR